MEPAEEPDANDVAIFDSAKEAAGGGDAGGQTIEQMYASTLGLEIDKARAKASIETAEAFWTAALADAHRVTSTPLLPSDGGMRRLVHSRVARGIFITPGVMECR